MDMGEFVVKDVLFFVENVEFVYYFCQSFIYSGLLERDNDKIQINEACLKRNENKY